jgi:fructokinase
MACAIAAAASFARVGVDSRARPRASATFRSTPRVAVRSRARAARVAAAAEERVTVIGEALWVRRPPPSSSSRSSSPPRRRRLVRSAMRSDEPSRPAPSIVIILPQDSLPAGLFLGGAPANVACHLNELGRPATIVSRVGDDELGREVVRRLTARGLDTSFIQARPSSSLAPVPARPRSHWSPYDRVRDVNADP